MKTTKELSFWNYMIYFSAIALIYIVSQKDCQSIL